jgi:hypothetical protein
VRHAFLLQPGPVCVAPPPAIAVAAGVHELQKLRVGHIVRVDVERVHGNGVRRAFVVPGKPFAGPERRCPGRNRDP